MPLQPFRRIGGVDPSLQGIGAIQNIQKTKQNELINLATQANIDEFGLNAPVREAAREGQLDAFTAQSMVAGATSAFPFVQANDLGGLTRNLEQRRQTIIERGGDTRHTDEILDMVRSGDANQIQQAGQIISQIAGIGGQGEAQDAKTQFGSGKKVIGTTQSGKRVNGTIEISRDPDTGISTSSFVPDVGQIDPNDPIASTQNVGSLGLTGEEQINLQTEAAEERKRTGETIVTEQTRIRQEQAADTKRKQTSVNEAIEVSDAVPQVRRALEILNLVETGGFEGAQLAAKRFFGIESANEGELASSLVTSVLGRLRETFGAQFTEREGSLLIKASANPSSSTATNRRLLEQQLKLWNRKIKRGRGVATALEDQFSLDIFDKNDEFNLSPNAPQQIKQEQFPIGTVTDSGKFIMTEQGWMPNG